MTLQSGQHKIFLSHNAKDKELARTLGGQLRLAGADVWFDEWEIRAGDSVPGKLDAGLSAFDVFVLLWSAHASRSQWVRNELEVAITRRIGGTDTRIIPVLLDETELPAMLSHLRFIRLDDKAAVGKATMEILGLPAQRDLIKALQSGLNSLGLDHTEFWGVGVLFGCPSCGAGLNAITGWQSTDDEHDRNYVGARCKECGWEDGSET
jgi:hypothetical protein